MSNTKDPIIAKFMGHTYVPDSQNDFAHYVINSVTFHPYQIKYSINWNWLMDVVQKIESLDFIVSIHHDVTNIFNGECSPLKYNETNQASSKLEACYNACVAFIEWYNQEQEKTKIVPTRKYFVFECDDVKKPKGVETDKYFEFVEIDKLIEVVKLCKLHNLVYEIYFEEFDPNTDNIEEKICITEEFNK